MNLMCACVDATFTKAQFKTSDKFSKMKAMRAQCQCLPDHPVHDEDVAQKSHHANDGVESRDGDGYDYTTGAPHRTLPPC